MESVFGRIEAHDLSPGILRQRRNLMVASLVMIFITHGGASLGSTSILGVELKFENPNAILHFAWMFLGYYLFRYYQYFRQDPDAQVSGVFFEDLKKRTADKIHAIKVAQYPEGDFTDGIGYDFRYLEKNGRWKRQFRVNVERGEKKIRESVYVQLDIRDFFWDEFRSLVSVFMNTSRITDYYLPFALAAFAIIYGLL